LPHDPRTRRIDARRLATYLDVPLSAIARAAGKVETVADLL
jgi:hypothetical protein